MAQEPVEVNEIEETEETVEGSPRQESRQEQAAPQQRNRRPYQPNRGQGGGQDDEDQEGGRGGRRPMRFQPRRRVCIFCADKTKVIDWKRADMLRRFVGDSGEIYPRRKSGLCAKHQRRVAVAIKRARHLALLPFTSEHIRVMSKS